MPKKVQVITMYSILDFERLMQKELNKGWEVEGYNFIPGGPRGHTYSALLVKDEDATTT